MREDLLKECFYTDSEYFKKMLNKFNEEQSEPFNKHHIIPRSYFKNNGLPVLNNDNLIQLSIINHLWVHYYAWKCAKPIIIKEMAAATKWIFAKLKKQKNIKDEEVAEIVEDYAKIRAMVEKNGKIYNKATCKKILCLEENKIYDTLHECAKSTGCDYRLVSKVINNKRICVNNKHFIIAEKESYSEEECKKIILEKEKNRPACCGIRKKVKCIETGEVFENGRKAALFYNIDYKFVNSAINNKKTANGLHFVYLEENDYNKNYSKVSTCKKVKCIETGEIFTSISEAQRFYNKVGLSSALKTGYAFAGYHWEYV